MTAAVPLLGAEISHVLVPSSVQGDGFGARMQTADGVTAPPVHGSVEPASGRTWPLMTRYPSGARRPHACAAS